MIASSRAVPGSAPSKRTYVSPSTILVASFGLFVTLVRNYFFVVMYGTPDVLMSGIVYA